MRILLTGASGFIGNILVGALATDHEIVCVGRSLPPSAPEGTKLIACDLSDGAGIAGLAKTDIGQLDAIAHLAVSRLHRTFPQTASDMFQVNVGATAALLDIGVRSNISRFVLGSTGSVYDGTKEPLLREDATLAPRNYFPVSKFAAEELTRAYENLFAVSILRFFTPYGPNQTDRLIPGLIERVSSNTPITLPETGDGLAFSAIFGEDAAKVIGHALTDSWTGVYNIASPEALNLRRAAEIMGKVLGKEPLFERSPSASNLSLLPDLTKLKGLMAADTFVPFKKGIEACVAS
jgi:UDP-glucose 4-epimerase